MFKLDEIADESPLTFIKIVKMRWTDFSKSRPVGDPIKNTRFYFTDGQPSKKISPTWFSDLRWEPPKDDAVIRFLDDPEPAFRWVNKEDLSK